MKDQIRLSSLCLFACILAYLGLAASVYEHGSRTLGILIGLYALGLYFVASALAIDLKRWAWRVTNVAFMIHLGAVLVFAIFAMDRGKSGYAAIVAWSAVGALGLWANRRFASRAILVPPEPTAA